MTDDVLRFEYHSGLRRMKWAPVPAWQTQGRAIAWSEGKRCRERPASPSGAL